MEEKQNVSEMLNDEIADLFEALQELEAGTEEYNKVINDLNTLYRLRNDENKIEYEADENYNRRVMEDKASEREETVREQQREDTKWDRWIKIGLGVLGVVVPLGFYNSWYKRGYYFEENGAQMSTTFREARNYISRGIDNLFK